MVKRNLKGKKEVIAKQVKKEKRNKLAYVLVLIASVFLLINGLLAIAAKDLIVKIMQQSGITTSAASWVTYGIIWIVLAFLLFIGVKKIESTGIRSEKWLLLALSVITLFSGMWLAGILLLVAAIIYLREK
jgi:hypothetical protein